MSVARGFINAGHFYSNLAKPIRIDLQFTVTATNGLGVTSLKSNGYVRNVFMHTSTTPASNDGALNPNPANGFAVVQLKQNMNAFLGAVCSVQSPLSGSDVAVLASGAPLTVGQAYVITTLGTSTAADWTAVGVPAGVTPAVGVSFVAISTGHGTGSGKVQVPLVSGVQTVEIVGTPAASIANSNIASNGGAYVLAQFLGATNSSTTTLIPVAPAAGSVVSMSLFFDGSSVTVDGL